MFKGIEIVNIATKLRYILIKRFNNIVFKSFAWLLILFIVTIVVLAIPTVQTYFAKKTTNYINKKYNTDISIDRVGLSFLGGVEAKGVFIADKKRDTLIYSGKLSTSLLSFANILNGKADFKNTSLEEVYVKMVTYKDAESDSFIEFINKFKPKDKGKQKDIELSFNKVSISNGKYIFINKKLKENPIVDIKHIDLKASNLLISNGNVNFHSDKLSFLYNNHIKVKDLTTQFHFESEKIELKTIHLLSENKSDIRGDFEINYRKNDFRDFNNKVKLLANIKTSKVSTSDLRLFYKEFGKNQMISISTKFRGTTNDFELKNLRLKGLNNSTIIGNLRLKNSMSKNKLQDFKISGNVNDLSTSKIDLSNLLPRVVGVYLPEQLEKFGKLTAIGTIDATPSSVNFNGDLETNLGSAKVDINLENLLSKSRAHYKGNIDVKDFNLKEYTGNRKFGKSSFKMDIDGYGFVLGDLDTYLGGDFSYLQYKGYNYKNLTVLGTLKYPFFDGKIVARDPNFDLDFDGVVNLNENINDYNFSAQVNNIDFKKINLFTRDSISTFKGNIVAKFKGTTIDNAFGEIVFNNTIYKNQKGTYNFKGFRLSSEFSEQGRTIKVNSPDIIQGTLTGKFKLKSLKNLFQNSLASLYKNYEAIIETETEYANFDFKIYNKIIDVFFPDIEVGANTIIKGGVDSDGAKFKLNFKSPRISYKQNTFKEINLLVDNSNKDQNTLLSVGNFSTKKYNLSNFNLKNSIKNDTLFSNSTFKGGKNNTDDFKIKLYHTINEFNRSVVGVKKSKAIINDNHWFINQKNDNHHKIEFDNNFNNVTIDSIKINHNNERISLNGKIIDSTYKDIQLKFSEVDLEKITPTIDSLEYRGIVNGTFNFIQKDKAYFPEGNLEVSDFILNDFEIGKFKIKASGNSDLTKYTIDSYIDNDSKKSLQVKGDIFANSKSPTVDFKVLFNQFDLEPFSPLGGIVLNNLRGKINGEAKVRGKYSNPKIDGNLKLNQAGLSFPYLNIDLKIEENSNIKLIQNKLFFEKTNISDTKFNTKGVLYGFISHNNFKTWNLDLQLNSDRFLVLNTNENDNELYYGTAFMNGKAQINGPTDKLNIYVEASSAEGTKFKIPISDTETIGDNSFIHFITPEEKKALKQGEKVYFQDVKGLELQFELDLNKYAEVEVVIDKESGSTLKGYGAGTLLIEINTNGKFNMWGDFVAYKGTYDFKYRGLLSKRFEVQTGNISWEGSPTGARLDLSAVYKTNANPSILLENSFLNRKIPVEVVTKLQGGLLKPDLSFDIKFPIVSAIVRSELDYILADRTIKERQAFSLITQGQFYNEELIGNNILTENLAERASDLVSSIFSDDDDKFNVGLNYNTADRRDLNNQISDQVGVSVSTQISNRILINGKVGIPVGGVTESVVVGDVQIDFLLNEDGTLRATIFNKEDNLQFIGETNQYTQGVGLSYSYDFNTFKELIRRILAKEKEKQTKN